MNRVLLISILSIVVVMVMAGHCYACHQPPVAVISEPKPKYTVKDEEPGIEIDGSNSWDPDDSITKYEWDWTDDGDYDCEETSSTNTCDDTFDHNAEHTYNTAGIYTVRLRVTDSVSGTDTETCKVFVSSDPCQVHNITQDTWHSHIQLAINAAVSGDVIEVSENTYYEAIDFNNKNVTVRSTNPDDWDVVEATIIDAANKVGPVVTFGGDEDPDPCCLLSGFTITGGNNASHGGGIYGGHTEATVSKCIIKDNTTQLHGGGLHSVSGIIDRCMIFDNTATQNGGGLAGCRGTIMNCLVYENSGGYGGGLNNCDADIVNCTIADNTATIEAGGLRNCDGTTTIANCIIWGNDPCQLVDSSTPTYSCFPDASGNNNIDADPCFVDSANDDYHIQPTSPCIDVGDPCGTYSGQTDIDGDDRVIDIGGIDDGNVDVDIGADEFNGVIYVDVDATSGNDNGGSWANAYLDLKDAVDAAGSGVEIWVADGTYTLTSSPYVDEEISIYGGFQGNSRVGGGETTRSQRDWETYVTTIDGDDSYHCFFVTDDCTVDGFTLTDGNTGIYCSGGTSDTIENCTFNSNTYHGIESYSSSLTITNCVFNSNGSGTYSYGGGIRLSGSGSTTITDCVFSGNTAEIGGGVYVNVDTVTIKNCVFSQNEATYNPEFGLKIAGGGLYVTYNTNVKLINCLFAGNYCEYGDGGAVACLFNNQGYGLTATNCTLVGNTARYGGAVYGYGPANTVSLRNSILWDNTASGGDGYEVYCDGGQYPYYNYIKLYYCYIESHSGDWEYADGDYDIVSLEGSGNTVTTTDPCFADDTNPDGNDDEWATSDDGFALSSTSDCVDEGYNPYTYSPDYIFYDITGSTDRRVSTVDIGAYEYDN